MLSLPIVSKYAVLIALAIVSIIGLDLLFRKPRRRGERGEARTELADGIDPATLRERRPLTQRLSGAVLLMAVFVILVALRDHF
jgi:cbb3-type cytochrome oxidase subunit 3